VAEAARDQQVSRFIHMSANGAAPHARTAYQTSKWKAEEHVRNVDFEHWTIFRPSLVFGDPGAGHEDFPSRLARQLIRPFPVLPVFGTGQYRLQPVSVEEVAAAFVQALTLEAADRQVYCVAGRDAYPYTEVLDRITRALGLAPKPKLSGPLWLVRPVVRTVGRAGLLPITPDQFEMLVEGNTCDPSAFYRDFDVAYRPFTPENLAYVRQRA
jgi:NADH dehydrogenase